MVDPGIQIAIRPRRIIVIRHFHLIMKNSALKRMVELL